MELEFLFAIGKKPHLLTIARNMMTIYYYNTETKTWKVILNFNASNIDDFEAIKKYESNIFKNIFLNDIRYKLYPDYRKKSIGHFNPIKMQIEINDINDHETKEIYKRHFGTCNGREIAKIINNALIRHNIWSLYLESIKEMYKFILSNEPGLLPIEYLAIGYTYDDIINEIDNIKVINPIEEKVKLYEKFFTKKK